MKFGIIIVTYNSQQDISRLLDSLNSQTFKNFAVYIVDNNSTDNTLNIIKGYQSELQISFIPCKINSGYAGGNNTGIRKAMNDGCEFAFILNPDIKLDERCLEILSERIKQDPIKEIGVLGPIVLFPSNNHDDNYKYENNVIQDFGVNADFRSQKKENPNLELNQKWSRDLPNEQYCDFVLGGAMMIRCSILKVTGYFDEDYFMYNDEIDIAYRIKKSGFKTVCLRDAIALHFHDFDKTNLRGYNLMYYYMLRNRFLYFKKYQLYSNLFRSLLYEIIVFPLKIIWALRRMKNFKILFFYYSGLIDGLRGKKGISNKSF